jgi:hypothetical protein
MTQHQDLRRSLFTVECELQMTKMKCDALEEENDFRAKRPSAEKGIQDSFELESKIEDLKWQLTSADIERIESANEKERLTRALADHRQNLESA